MRHFEIAFDEVTIPLAQENTRTEILRYTPAGPDRPHVPHQIFLTASRRFFVAG